jgi:3-oxoacyl-[acyl-carrier protein] reductase
VIGFTRSLAREVGDDNICVNAITPGFTASDTQLASSDPQYTQKMASINSRKAIKRTQTPDDLVGAMLFLLSSASDYISGQTINVDGGFVMH